MIIRTSGKINREILMRYAFYLISPLVKRVFYLMIFLLIVLIYLSFSMQDFTDFVLPFIMFVLIVFRLYFGQKSAVTKTIERLQLMYKKDEVDTECNFSDEGISYICEDSRIDISFNDLINYMKLKDVIILQVKGNELIYAFVDTSSEKGKEIIRLLYKKKIPPKSIIF